MVFRALSRREVAGHSSGQDPTGQGGGDCGGGRSGGGGLGDGIDGDGGGALGIGTYGGGAGGIGGTDGGDEGGKWPEHEIKGVT